MGLDSQPENRRETEVSDIPQLDISHIARSAEVARKFLLRQVVKDERHRAAEMVREKAESFDHWDAAGNYAAARVLHQLADRIESGE